VDLDLGLSVTVRLSGSRLCGDSWKKSRRRHANGWLLRFPPDGVVDVLLVSPHQPAVAVLLSCP
jgi:hypothetical protein